MALSRARRLRIAAGRSYAATWRAAADALQRVAPASQHWWLRAPALPDQPVRREFGIAQGTPIDAFYARRFLAHHAQDIRGRVLEWGAPGFASAAAGDQITTLDMPGAAGAATPGAYDCVVSVDALAHAVEPRAALAALVDALRGGGVLLVVVPGLRQRRLAGVAEDPELWRFTADGLALLLREAFGAAHVAVETQGTIRSAAALLYGMPEQLVPPAMLQPPDPDFEIAVCARAVKAA
jgi:SAM-dependent methyltransferase